MKFENLKSGMVFRKHSPPPYMMIYKTNRSKNSFYGLGFSGEVIDVDFITKEDWIEWFEQECELINIEDITGSLLHLLIRQMFECIFNLEAVDGKII